MAELKDYWEKLRKIVSAHPKGKALDKDGRFYPDPTPVAPPVGFTDDIDMFERVRQMVRREMSVAAQGEGFETFEEADDFDVGDDVEPFSPYELILEQAAPDAPVVNPDPDQVHPPEVPPKATETPGGGGSVAPKPASSQPAPNQA